MDVPVNQDTVLHNQQNIQCYGLSHYNELCDMRILTCENTCVYHLHLRICTLELLGDLELFPSDGSLPGSPAAAL